MTIIPNKIQSIATHLTYLHKGTTSATTVKPVLSDHPWAKNKWSGWSLITGGHKTVKPGHFSPGLYNYVCLHVSLTV